MVSGHVDSIGQIKNIDGENIDIKFDERYYPLLRHKGSVSIDGISLTIAELYNDYFTVCIIPFTWDNTIIKHYNINDYVNIEFDHNIKQWEHSNYMKMALKLSEINKGYTLPNPWVGCIITNKQGLVIGKGRHEKYGKEHAEINAINDLNENILDNNKSNANQCSEDTYNVFNIYITLEPCCHSGKTGPCIDEIIKLRPQNVIIGILDPNPVVSGQGMQKLIENKINVIYGICKNEIINSLEPYIYYHKKKIPYITGKIATTLNNVYKYSDTDKRMMISNFESFSDTHKLRSECSGILIGKNTWIKDKPQLTVRYNYLENPRYKKYIICNNLDFLITEIDNYFDNKNKNENENKIYLQNYKFITFNDSEYEKFWNIVNKKYTNPLSIPVSVLYFNNIKNFLNYLYDIDKIVHLLIEGGLKTLNSFTEYINQFVYYIHNTITENGEQFKFNTKLKFKNSEILNDCVKITMK